MQKRLTNQLTEPRVIRTVERNVSSFRCFSFKRVHLGNVNPHKMRIALSGHHYFLIFPILLVRITSDTCTKRVGDHLGNVNLSPFSAVSWESGPHQNNKLSSPLTCREPQQRYESTRRCKSRMNQVNSPIVSRFGQERHMKTCLLSHAPDVEEVTHTLLRGAEILF